MRFQPGKSGNPGGRRKGSVGGRSLALAVLDAMLAKSSNREKLARALQAKFSKDPVGFFRTMVMPLVPKEAKVAVENDGIVLWRNLQGQDVKAEDVGGKRSEVGDQRSAR